MSKTALQLLTEARQRLTTSWGRGMMGKANGSMVRPWDHKADTWCAIGAILCGLEPKNRPISCYRIDTYSQETVKALEALNGSNVNCQTSQVSIIRISNENDRQESVEPVLAWFDRAIDKLKGEEGNEQNSVTTAD